MWGGQVEGAGGEEGGEQEEEEEEEEGGVMWLLGGHDGYGVVGLGGVLLDCVGLDMVKMINRGRTTFL